MARAPKSAHIRCPECRAVVEVPISYGKPEVLAGDDGTQYLNVPFDTDMADLWAHAWTHSAPTRPAEPSPGV